MKLTHADELLLHRFLDGELAPGAAQAFEARLAAEPLLHRHVEHAKALRAGFVAWPAGPTPRAGFTAGVLAAARALPGRQQLQRDDEVAAIVRACRRLLIAAALLFGISLAWHAGLVDGGRSDTLQAAPSWEVEQEMKRLDALIEALTASGALGPRGSGPADARHPAESRPK